MLVRGLPLREHEESAPLPVLLIGQVHLLRGLRVVHRELRELQADVLVPCNPSRSLHLVLPVIKLMYSGASCRTAPGGADLAHHLAGLAPPSEATLRGRRLGRRERGLALRAAAPRATPPAPASLPLT
jgi:hypothetical protein